MWLVRLRMRYARPCARGWNRFMVGPSSTVIVEITSVEGSRSKLFSAFATALATSLATGVAAACWANCSTEAAWPTGMPRTRSTTRRTFIGDMRT